MILQAPNPRLTKECVVCKPLQGIHIGKLLAKEFKAAQKANPDFTIVGLAAPQIGLTRRVFYALGRVFINPTIMSRSSYEITAREGCMSLSNEIFETHRANSVNVAWMDNARRLQHQTFTGSEAVIIQHEMDHLSGILLAKEAIRG